MSALEAMSGGPWLFASVALLGLGLAAGLTSLTRLLAVLYTPETVVATMVIGLSGFGVGAALAHGSGKRHEPPLLPIVGAAVGAGGLALLGLLAPLLTSDLPASLAAGLIALPAGAAGFTLAVSFTAVDRRTGHMMAAWLAGSAAGLPLGLGLLLLLTPVESLAWAAVLLAGAALCSARAADRWHRATLAALGGAVLLAAAIAAVPSATLEPDRIGVGAGGARALLRGSPATASLAPTRWDATGRVDTLVVAGSPRVFADGSVLPTIDQAALAWLGLGPTKNRTLLVAPDGLGEGCLASGPGGEALSATVTTEGRAWLRPSEGLFNLIWLCHPGTPALHPLGLTVAGQPDLTLEAFEGYLNQLTPDGVLLVHLAGRLALQRAALTAVAALERLGTPTGQAAHQIVLVEEPPGLLAVRMRPFTQEEAIRVNEHLMASDWRPLYLPHLTTSSPLAEIASGSSLAAVARRVPQLMLTPATDRVPSFNVLTRDLPLSVWLPLVIGGLVLLALLGYLAWTIEPEHYRIWRAVPFTLITGASGILLGLGLAARLHLPFGGFAAAATATTTILGLWAALGALLSDRFSLEQVTAAARVAGTFVAAWAMVEFFGLLLPFGWLHIPSPVVRVALLAAVLAPVGIALGLPLPMLLRAAQRRYAGRPMALLWAIHGGAIAMGAAVATALALRYGPDALLLALTALCVGLALLARPALAR